MITGTRGTFHTSSSGVSRKRLFALVLAAGSSSRFGSPKQLAVYRGSALVTRAVRLAEGICGPGSVLVAGHAWRDVVDACRPMQGFFVNNTDYSGGMSSSIACGIRAVTGAADAVLLLLADQPLIPASHLEQLVAMRERCPEDVIATSFAGTSGPPVIFPARCFAELERLRGDRGARELLESDSHVRTVRLEAAGADIDVSEDLDRLPHRP